MWEVVVDKEKCTGDEEMRQRLSGAGIRNDRRQI